MKATDVIIRDHRAAEALFEEFKGAADADEREAVTKKLFKALTTHELMEDTHFYPALNDMAGDDEAVKEIKHQQTELKLEVMGVMAMDTLTGERDERITKMMEKVLAHAKEEESEILPKAEELLGEEKLEELGSKMEPDSAVANA
ncbi:MAG: hemerythrin [Parcubacteria group bacterium]|nr:hemerythrin [Parcubacteria group bacterium]